MKKFIATVLSLALMISLSACGGKAGNLSHTDQGSSNPQKSEFSSEQGGTSTQDSQIGTAAAGDWASLYQSYSEAISVASDQLTTAAGDEISFDIISILNGEVDLALCSSFFTEDAKTVNEMMFAMFNYTNVKYAQSVDTATLTAKSADGEENTFELKYDGKNSGQLTLTEDGTITYIMTFCVGDGYVAKSYTDSANNMDIHAVCFENGNVHLGISESSQPSVSLYQNADAASDASFATEMEKVLEVANGEFKTNSK